MLAYALGKLFLGGLGDFWGGRLNFLIGLAGATVFTLLFAVTGVIPIFTLAWLGNRLTQSMSWAGLIKVSSKWFDFSSYGTVIGILSVSFLVGDAVARQLMGLLIHHGFGWRALFYFAAAVAAACLLINLLFLRESRTDLGFAEARTNPLNLFAQSESRPPRSPPCYGRCSAVRHSNWCACCPSRAPSFAKPSTTGRRSICTPTWATARAMPRA